MLAAHWPWNSRTPVSCRKAQRGDERAFSIIVRAYERPVYNYVLRLVGDRALAEDRRRRSSSASTRVSRFPPPSALHDLALPGDEEPRARRAARAQRPRRGVVALDASRRSRRSIRRSSAPRRSMRSGGRSRRSTSTSRWRSAPRHRRPVVHRDRRLARDHARHRQVADLQGARRSAGRARARRDHGEHRDDHAQACGRRRGARREACAATRAGRHVFPRRKPLHSGAPN